MKPILTFLIVLLCPVIALGQYVTVPQISQPATFQQVQPHVNMMPQQRHFSEAIEQAPRNATLPNHYLADKEKIERERIEYQREIASINEDVQALEQSSYINSMLDTTFGQPPVISKQQYETGKSFWDALLMLTDMQQGKRDFSITEAVYTVENAYLSNKLNKEEFIHAIQLRAELCKQIIKQEKLDPNNDLSKHFAIQKLYQQDHKYNDPNNRKKINVPKLGYDFNDFMGDSSHTQMFVSKLLTTGKGQCHSMPLFYLCIAEQLGAKAYLSLAPEHSFIRFSDENGNLYNFETTNGKIVSDKWVLQSGYINTASLQNKIYLDTLSQKQLLSLCILDLAMGYQFDNGYDGFTETALKKALKLYPTGIQHHIMLSNFWAIKMFSAIKYYKITNPETLPRYPIAHTLQKRMLREYEIIDRLGYQQMPKDAYQAWLQSVDEEREKQNMQQSKQQ